MLLRNHIIDEKILNYSHVTLDIWIFHIFIKKIGEAVLPNGFQNSSISIKKLLHQRSHNWNYFSHRYRPEALLIYLKVDCLQYKIKWFKQMYVVDVPLRSEKKTLRHNTKQETSPLDASDAIHTNRFQIYRGTK